MVKPFETAAELYREIKRRGLHLRKDYGRDNVLLKQLCAELSCSDGHLQKFLDKSNLSAEDFLRTFLKITEPFSRMFAEIWKYLAGKCAPDAHEAISIRFGFPESGQHSEVDFEAFRRYIRSTEEVLTSVRMTLWPSEALYKLFELSKILLSEGPDYTSYDYERYNPGKPYVMPQVTEGPHEFDTIIRRIRDLFQRIIDDYAAEHEVLQTKRHLPELRETTEEDSEKSNLRNAAYLLTDLLPRWTYLLKNTSLLPPSSKDNAYMYYMREIEPALSSGMGLARVPLLRALDILDLPFWRYRWHTYEIWGTILTLQALDQYKPNLRIVDGRIPLDGYRAEIIADLRAKGYEGACVAIQVQTPFDRPPRKAIKPDLRICFSQAFTPDQTAVIVEFKQRLKLTSQSIEEVASAYRDGSPRIGGVLVLNYDTSHVAPQMASDCFLIQGLHPGNFGSIKAFWDCLLRALKSAGLSPEAENVVVLLDVSGSMGHRYNPVVVQEALRRLLSAKWLRILRFNNGLVPGGDLDETTCEAIRTSGGTELGRALDDMERIYGLPEKLLVVTDGGHDHPNEKLARISCVRECVPSDLSDFVPWILS